MLSRPSARLLTGGWHERCLLHIQSDPHDSVNRAFRLGALAEDPVSLAATFDELWSDRVDRAVAEALRSAWGPEVPGRRHLVALARVVADRGLRAIQAAAAAALNGERLRLHPATQARGRRLVAAACTRWPRPWTAPTTGRTRSGDDGVGRVEEVAGQLRDAHGFGRDRTLVDDAKIAFFDDDGTHHRMAVYFPEATDRTKDLALSFQDHDVHADRSSRVAARLQGELGVEVHPRVSDPSRPPIGRPKRSSTGASRGGAAR